MAVVLGVDGSRGGGWVAVRLRDGRLDEVTEHAEFGSILADAREAAAVAIDIPIGHDDPDGKRNAGRREADLEAQRFLGARRSSVFHVPPPVVLAQPDHAAACAKARALGLPAPSVQLFRLKPRIEEVARVARRGDRLFEVHPEVSFVALQQALGNPPLDHPKKTWNGLHERLALLHAAGLRPARSVGGVGRASPDDVLDATVAAWTAARLAAGTAVPLPAEPPPDPATGRPVALWR